jgi:hypothetical protein
MDPVCGRVAIKTHSLAPPLLNSELYLDNLSFGVYLSEAILSCKLKKVVHLRSGQNRLSRVLLSMNYFLDLF